MKAEKLEEENKEIKESYRKLKNHKERIEDTCKYYKASYHRALEEITQLKSQLTEKIRHQPESIGDNTSTQPPANLLQEIKYTPHYNNYISDTESIHTVIN